MRQICNVVGCANKEDSKEKYLFRFPFDDKILFPKWVQATGRVNWVPSNISRICSDHFLLSDYKKGCRRVELKKKAVPVTRFTRSLIGVGIDDVHMQRSIQICQVKPLAVKAEDIAIGSKSTATVCRNTVAVSPKSPAQRKTVSNALTQSDVNATEPQVKHESKAKSSPLEEKVKLEKVKIESPMSSPKKRGRRQKKSVKFKQPTPRTPTRREKSPKAEPLFCEKMQESANSPVGTIHIPTTASSDSQIPDSSTNNPMPVVNIINNASPINQMTSPISSYPTPEVKQEPILSSPENDHTVSTSNNVFALNSVNSTKTTPVKYYLLSPANTAKEETNSATFQVLRGPMKLSQLQLPKMTLLDGLSPAGNTRQASLEVKQESIESPETKHAAASDEANQPSPSEPTLGISIDDNLSLSPPAKRSRKNLIDEKEASELNDDDQPDEVVSESAVIQNLRSELKVYQRKCSRQARTIARLEDEIEVLTGRRRFKMKSIQNIDKIFESQSSSDEDIPSSDDSGQ